MLLLSVMGLIIVAPLLWGDAILANILETPGVLIGSLSILAARYLPDGTPPTA